MAEIFIIDLSTGKRLEFQNIPQMITDSRTANINGVTIIGSNLPDYGFSASSNQLRFRIDFYSDDDSKEDVRDKCNFLKGLTFSEGKNIPLTKIKLIYGELYTEETWTMSGCIIEYKLFNKDVGMLPQQAHIDVTLDLDLGHDIVKIDVQENRIR